MLRGIKEKNSLYVQVETKTLYMLCLITQEAEADLIIQLRWLGQMTVRACAVLQWKKLDNGGLRAAPQRGWIGFPLAWHGLGRVAWRGYWVPTKWIGSILRDNSCFIPLSPSTTQMPQCTALHRSSSHGVDLSHQGHIVLLHKSVAVCAYLSVDLAARDMINWHSMKSER